MRTTSISQPLSPVWKTNGGMVDTKEDFMKLDPAEIFSDEMEAAIEKVDVDSLEPVMAGIVLGDGARTSFLVSLRMESSQSPE